VDIISVITRDDTVLKLYEVRKQKSIAINKLSGNCFMYISALLL